jgi:hypothetical protein
MTHDGIPVTDDAHAYGQHDLAPPVITHWITTIEYVMPRFQRDSARWRELVLIASESPGDHESELRPLVASWTWQAVAQLIGRMPKTIQPTWRKLCTERSDAYADWAAETISRALDLADLDESQRDVFWQRVKPANLLVQLIAVTEKVAA